MVGECKGCWFAGPPEDRKGMDALRMEDMNNLAAEDYFAWL